MEQPARRAGLHACGAGDRRTGRILLPGWWTSRTAILDQLTGRAIEPNGQHRLSRNAPLVMTSRTAPARQRIRHACRAYNWYCKTTTARTPPVRTLVRRVSSRTGWLMWAVANCNLIVDSIHLCSG
ncbi:hypothetical protein PCANC_03338 [Puccinia coronata f. sp. avenae]|uniref:Uncharacterized protein n=1 Tax=Puccinia coronata f. sp. avenae TaxID=200324 RepID=A0A2N5T8N9_9BASI|nr:hypothetical protein PCANC_03338 [Puccinia coronata f. sp. avenae]